MLTIRHRKMVLFNGDYSALAQINFGLGEAFDLALTYTRTYDPQGEVSLTEGLGSFLGGRSLSWCCRSVF